MQQPPSQYPQYPQQQWQQPPMPPQQQWNSQQPPFPPQHLSALPETTLCDREILESYHAVELYQDGALWIIDEEDPPIEIKLDAQAAQRLRDFMTRLDGQQYKTPYPYQQQQYPKPMQPVKQPTKRDNGDAIFWLLIFRPVSLYMMWKYAKWPDVVKGIISLALVGFTLLWWLHSFA